MGITNNTTTTNKKSRNKKYPLKKTATTKLSATDNTHINIHTYTHITHTHTHPQHTKHFDFCFLLPAAVFCLWKLASMNVRTLCESLPLSLRQSAPDVLMLLDQCSVSGSCPCTMWKKMPMLEIHTVATTPTHPPPKSTKHTHKKERKKGTQWNGSFWNSAFWITVQLQIRQKWS